MGRYVPFSIGAGHVIWAAASPQRSIVALTEQVTDKEFVPVGADIHPEENNYRGANLILLYVGHQDLFHIRSSTPKYIIHTPPILNDAS